jgi:hypothetical protein
MILNLFINSRFVSRNKIAIKKKNPLLNVVGIISLMLMISFVSLSVQAKSIKKDALVYASNYFGYSAAQDILLGADVNKSLEKMGRSDFKFMGKGQQNGVLQSGYISIKPNFLMATISREVNSQSVISVNFTKIDTDIPYSKIKYLAFDSRTDGKGKNKVKTFYMGDGAANGIPIRHLLQESAEFSGAEYKQITWLYAVNYK